LKEIGSAVKYGWASVMFNDMPCEEFCTLKKIKENRQLLQSVLFYPTRMVTVINLSYCNCLLCCYLQQGVTLLPLLPNFGLWYVIRKSQENQDGLVWNKTH
jgi:hypothetical protein